MTTAPRPSRACSPAVPQAAARAANCRRSLGGWLSCAWRCRYGRWALLDRRPGYYWVKITLTVYAFFAGWALFVIVGKLVGGPRRRPAGGDDVHPAWLHRP